MWTADKIIYNGIDTYIKAYQGSSLIWEKTIVEDPSDDITLPYVTFRAEEAGSTIGLTKKSSYQTLQYSTDKSTWNTFDTSVNVTLANVGDEVYVRGKLSSDINSYSNKTRFKMTGKIAAYGNCNAIWDYEDLNAPLKRNCGLTMFWSCTSLTKAPKLPATTLAYECYNYMFYDCTSLTQAPELPATTLADYCYCWMFDGCTSLTQAPKLPATTLADYCYEAMFQNCKSLTQAPVLPATTLAEGCYSFMFWGCTSLTQAPKLPTTTLADWCYEAMFQNCKSLTQAPVLPATTLAEGCYSEMFKDCTALNEIMCYAKTFGNDATQDWVSNVASTGTFYKDFETEWTTGTSGIPSGWTIINMNEPEVPEEDPADDITLPYITFRAEQAGSFVSLSYRHPNHTLEYSTDKINWSAFVTSPTGWTSIRLANIGDEVYVRGKLTSNSGISTYTQFNIRTGKVAAYGNCNAIWNYEDLNAPLIYEGCGYKMFQNCLALTKAPKLPATTLTNSCYQSMFDNCPALINVPELPATKLVTACYANMFMDCTSLQEITCLATDISADKCLTGWVIRVSSAGTFYKAPGIEWPTGTSGIPSGWTVLDYTA